MPKNVRMLLGWHIAIFLVAFTCLFSCRNNKPSLVCKSIDSLNTQAQLKIFDQPDSAFNLLSRAIKLAEQSNCLAGKGFSHHLLGVVLLNQGIYQEALNQLLKANQLFQALDEKQRMADNLNQQGLVYFRIKQPDLAKQSHEAALRVYEEIRDTLGIAYSYGCIGRIFEKREDYQEAIRYQTQALELYKLKQDKRGMAIILENIGSIHEDNEKFPLAMEYFRQSLLLNEQTHDSLSMIGIINNIGDNYRKTGDYKKAIEWTKKSLSLANRLGDKYQLTSAYKDLSKIYSLAGDYEKAYENLEIGRNLYEEMYDRDASKQLQLFQTLFEIERKNFAIKNLEADTKLNTAIKVALTISIGLLALVGTVVISRQRLKIKQSKEMLSQQQQIYEAQQKLMEAEIQNTHLQEQKLQQELEAKSKSLTSHTLHIISKNKMMEDIQLKLSALLKEGIIDQRKEIKGVVKMIERNFVQDKDWDDFRQIFEQVHQNFFHQLQSHAEDLTPADLRLASLIRLNIPSKDMATLLGISADSLRIGRYRLKKKLQVEQGSSLNQFINNI